MNSTINLYQFQLFKLNKIIHKNPSLNQRMTYYLFLMFYSNYFFYTQNNNDNYKLTDKLETGLNLNRVGINWASIGKNYF